MSKENSAGLGVNNRYGTLSTPDAAAGVFKTEGAYNELVIEFSGDNVNNDDIAGFIPAGATPVNWVLEVKSAFTLTGTSPVLNVGTDGSESTNGLQMSEANLESVGTVESSSFNGTWDARLASATNVAAALGGTSPTISGGEARLIVRYVKS